MRRWGELETIADGSLGLATKTRRIRQLVERAKRDPMFRRMATQNVQDLPARDHDGEIKRTVDFVRRRVRYVRDPWSPTGLELFQTPQVLLRDALEGTGAGDCDDQVILGSAMLESLGYPTRYRVGAAGPQDYRHIWLEVSHPKRGWTPVEMTRPLRIGYDPAPHYPITETHTGRATMGTLGQAFGVGIRRRLYAGTPAVVVGPPGGDIGQLRARPPRTRPARVGLAPRRTRPGCVRRMPNMRCPYIPSGSAPELADLEGFGKIFKRLKKVVKKALPIVGVAAQFFPGVGTLVGAGIGLASRFLQKTPPSPQEEMAAGMPPPLPYGMPMPGAYEPPGYATPGFFPAGVRAGPSPFYPTPTGAPIVHRRPEYAREPTVTVQVGGRRLAGPPSEVLRMLDPRAKVTQPDPYAWLQSFRAPIPQQPPRTQLIEAPPPPYDPYAYARPPLPSYYSGYPVDPYASQDQYQAPRSIWDPGFAAQFPRPYPFEGYDPGVYGLGDWKSFFNKAKKIGYGAGKLWADPQVRESLSPALKSLWGAFSPITDAIGLKGDALRSLSQTFKDVRQTLRPIYRPIQTVVKTLQTPLRPFYRPIQEMFRGVDVRDVARSATGAWRAAQQAAPAIEAIQATPWRSRAMERVEQVLKHPGGLPIPSTDDLFNRVVADAQKTLGPSWNIQPEQLDMWRGAIASARGRFMPPEEPPEGPGGPGGGFGAAMPLLLGAAVLMVVMGGRK